ncbi:MAG: arsinothricin resistance N-acetyltransferase ArsN1 family B [Planctomycetota bacterium]
MHQVIRLATLDDAVEVQHIYAPIVVETAVSFELEPPSVEEMRRRIETTLLTLPWLVCACDGVIGYAYAGPFRSRPAYQWTVEVSAYVHVAHRGKGVARALYTSLFECLRVQGYRTALAGIALPNSASVALHERMGFRSVGVFHHVGYKLGAWHDVGWWELSLQSLPDPPSPPRAQVGRTTGQDCGGHPKALWTGERPLQPGKV